MGSWLASAVLCAAVLTAMFRRFFDLLSLWAQFFRLELYNNAYKKYFKPGFAFSNPIANPLRSPWLNYFTPPQGQSRGRRCYVPEYAWPSANPFFTRAPTTATPNDCAFSSMTLTSLQKPALSRFKKIIMKIPLKLSQSSPPGGQIGSRWSS